MKPMLDRAGSDVVLVVDDVPDNLSVLHDARDESGSTVLVATSGEAALQRAAQALPDIVLLDAMMPGLDGFEVARRMKAQSRTAHIPIIFMTGLTETEHLVAALEAGGVDYVTKPIKPREVLARMGVHLQGARLARQTRNALDAFGYASIAVRASDGRLMWQTPLARELLHTYYGTSAPDTPPASSAATRCSVSVSPVMKMIGMCAVCACAFRRLATSKPSRPGIIASSSTMSGSACAARCRAASPLVATSTV